MSQGVPNVYWPSVLLSLLLALLIGCRPSTTPPTPDTTPADYPRITLNCTDNLARGDDVYLNATIGRVLLATGGYIEFRFSGTCDMRQPMYIPDLPGHVTFYGGYFYTETTPEAAIYLMDEDSTFGG